MFNGISQKEEFMSPLFIVWFVIDLIIFGMGVILPHTKITRKSSRKWLWEIKRHAPLLKSGGIALLLITLFFFLASLTIT